MRNFGDCIDNLNRKHVQAKSILVTLTSDDQFSTLSDEVVSGALWAVFEAIEDAEKTVNDLDEIRQAQRRAEQASADPDQRGDA